MICTSNKLYILWNDIKIILEIENVNQDYLFHVTLLT